MTFNYFKNRVAADLIIVATKEVVFATMDQTDVSLIELDTTYGALTKQGVSSFKLTATDPAAETAVMNIGVPMTGVAELGLRRSYCRLTTPTVQVLEGDYRFLTSYPHRCSIVGGNSGSPVLDRSIKTILALINTGSDDRSASKPDCSLNKPCEWDNGVKIVKSDRNYAQSISFISGCFSADGVFNKTLPTCQSEKYQTK